MQRRPLLIALPLLGVLALVAVVGTIAFAARQSTAPAPSPPRASVSLTQASWTLTRLLVDGQDQLLVPARAPTLQFRPHDGTIVGEAGCNSYGVDYALQGERLHLSHPNQSLVMCADARVMQQEYTYMSALLRVARVQVAGATLTLLSDDGRVQLTFQARAS